jgi:hypothetical protein
MTKNTANKLSFPNMGGTAVSSDTLPASLHIHRRTGSERYFLI